MICHLLRCFFDENNFVFGGFKKNLLQTFKIPRTTVTIILANLYLLDASSRSEFIDWGNRQMEIIYYIADLPVTRLRLLTKKSDNKAVPCLSLRSLMLLLSSLSFAFLTRFYEARGMLDSVSHSIAYFDV